MHTDPLFYRLFQERPELLFDLAGLAVPSPASYQMQAVEVKQTAFRLDAVLVPPPDQLDAPLIFAEAQFQCRPRFYARWLAAIFLYLYRHQVTRPWLAVVVFPERAADHGVLTPYAGLIDGGLLRRVYLSDLLDAEAIGFNVRLARLVILDPAATPTEARALAAARDTTPDPLESLDLLETILVYKFPHWSREEIRDMLHLPINDVKKTRFYQEVFAEGREEGREEAERALIQRLLARRCGPLSPSHQTHLLALGHEQLGALAEALLDFRSVDDLDAWLQAH